MIGYYPNLQWIEENYVEDLGILRQYSSGSSPDQYDAHVAPLSIHGNTLTVDNELIQDGVARLEITLHSDIWFPWVVNLSNANSVLVKVTTTNGLYDNRQLALRHTPRLNRFLEGVMQATHKLGGHWALDQESVHPRYRDQVTENGIHLEYPPDFTVTEAKPREKTVTIYKEILVPQPNLFTILKDKLRRHWR